MTRPQFIKYVKSLGFLYNNRDKIFEFEQYYISINVTPDGILDICLRTAEDLIHDGNSYLDMYGYIEYNKLFK